MILSEKVQIPDIIIVICAICVALMYPYQINIKKELQDESNHLNITSKFNSSFLLFNRTPKSGTKTIVKLLALLQKINNFTSYTDDHEAKKHEDLWMSKEKQEKLAYFSKL